MQQADNCAPHCSHISCRLWARRLVKEGPPLDAHVADLVPVVYRHQRRRPGEAWKALVFAALVKVENVSFWVKPGIGLAAKIYAFAMRDGAG